MLFDLDDDPGSSGSLHDRPGALLGVLGLVVMFGLTRRSDRAAEAAGVVAVPERTRTLALACATVVPFSVALVSFVAAVVAWYVHPPADYVVPPGVSDAFVHAEMFGDGVICAVGGPLLGLLLARYLPRRGVAAVASVLLVLVTILLQGGLVGGEQPYRVFWFWTYFLDPAAEGEPRVAPLQAPCPATRSSGCSTCWSLCALGLVVAVRHDPESDRATLDKVAIGLGALAVVLGVLTMTVGYTESSRQPRTSAPVC